MGIAYNSGIISVDLIIKGMVAITYNCNETAVKAE